MSNPAAPLTEPPPCGDLRHRASCRRPPRPNALPAAAPRRASGRLPPVPTRLLAPSHPRRPSSGRTSTLAPCEKFSLDPASPLVCRQQAGILGRRRRRRLILAAAASALCGTAEPFAWRVEQVIKGPLEVAGHKD